MKLVIKARIGSLDAIEVVSYPRLLFGLIVCNLPFVGSYQLILLMHPANRWWPALKYLGAHIACYFLVGVAVVAPFGYVIDGGRAIRVLSGRFKPGPQPHLVDLTKEQGRVAQLIPRGVAFAYQVLVLLSLIAIVLRRAVSNS
jgi:hypothetical protein